MGLSPATPSDREVEDKMPATPPSRRRHKRRAQRLVIGVDEIGVAGSGVDRSR